MNTHKMKAASLLFAFFILSSPVASHAYFTTAQSATKIASDTILYTISYGFGFADRELYMPIMATRSGSSTAQNLVKYEIVDNDDQSVSLGVSNGLVFTNSSDVTIKNGQYYLEPGEAATFTLIALLTIPEDQQANEKLSLLMTHLPFTMVKGGNEILSHLNPSELQYYRTPEVKI